MLSPATLLTTHSDSNRNRESFLGSLEETLPVESKHALRLTQQHLQNPNVTVIED
jgi:hypothetical protein